MSPITDQDQIIGQLRKENDELKRHLQKQTDNSKVTSQPKYDTLDQNRASAICCGQAMIEKDQTIRKLQTQIDHLLSVIEETHRDLDAESSARSGKERAADDFQGQASDSDNPLTDHEMMLAAVEGLARSQATTISERDNTIHRLETLITDKLSQIDSLDPSRTAVDAFAELFQEHQRDLLDQIKLNVKECLQEETLARNIRGQEFANKMKDFTETPTTCQCVIDLQTEPDPNEKKTLDESTIQIDDLEKKVAAATIQIQGVEATVERLQAEGTRQADEIDQIKNERDEALMKAEDLEEQCRNLFQNMQVLGEEKNDYRNRLDGVLAEVEELNFDVEGLKFIARGTRHLMRVDGLSRGDMVLFEPVDELLRDLPSRASRERTRDVLERILASKQEETAVVHSQGQQNKDLRQSAEDLEEHRTPYLDKNSLASSNEKPDHRQSSPSFQDDDDDDTTSVDQCFLATPSSSNSSYEDAESELEAQEF